MKVSQVVDALHYDYYYGITFARFICPLNKSP